MSGNRKKDARTAEQRMFEGLGNARGGAWLEKLLGRLLKEPAAYSERWSESADRAIDQQQLMRARGLLYCVAVVFTLLLVWSGFARIDEVTRGEGRVIPSRQLQVVQSVDGGVVEEIFISEGDMVEGGQVLARIDPTRFVANLREGSARAFALQAKIARLTALVDGAPYVPDAVEMNEAQGREAALILAQESQFYAESRRQLDERLLIARQQLDQRRSELREAQAAESAAQRGYDIAQEELTITRPLASSGAVSQVDILRLEGEVSRAQGDLQRAQARISQLMGGIREAETNIRNQEVTMRNEWRAELSAATAELNSLGESVEGLADRVKFSEVRSPVSGVVQRVLNNTVGGVVQPGSPMIEIVPTGDTLVVEAKISPRDIAFLRPGLPAVAKFTAYDFAVYGGMDATLTHISPDSITDENGVTYYLARAETAQTQFREDLPVIPGMVVQLDVLTGKRTILSYLLKPILRARQNALTER